MMHAAARKRGTSPPQGHSIKPLEGGPEGGLKGHPVYIIITIRVRQMQRPGIPERRQNDGERRIALRPLPGGGDEAAVIGQL